MDILGESLLYALLEDVHGFMDDFSNRLCPVGLIFEEGEKNLGDC